MMKPYILFSSGRFYSTPGALAACVQADVDPTALFVRHLTGDWGELGTEDKELNTLAVHTGDRIVSRYSVGEASVYVITEADRSSTTLLLVSEY